MLKRRSLPISPISRHGIAFSDADATPAIRIETFKIGYKFRLIV
jgi:hypothetical protein